MLNDHSLLKFCVIVMWAILHDSEPFSCMSKPDPMHMRNWYSFKTKDHPLSSFITNALLDF